jgi:hypothetical protein
MIQKKDTTNIHEKIIQKKKKRKNTKNLLTSMTSHVKKDEMPEEEEAPEDGELEQVEEETNTKFKGRRDSAVSESR